MSVRNGVIGSRRPGLRIPGRRRRATARDAGWASGSTSSHARLFVMPAVIMILVFSIFPLIASAILALSRVRLKAGGYNIRFVGLANFEKQLFGSEQFHFLGTFETISPLGWAFTIAVGALLVWWLVRYLRGPVWLPGLIGRLITAAHAVRARAVVRGDAVQRHPVRHARRDPFLRASSAVRCSS